jgi:hypothetical protein
MHIYRYIFSSIIHDCLSTSGQVSDLTLEDIRRFGREEFVESIWELCVVLKETPPRLLERERKRW